MVRVDRFTVQRFVDQYTDDQLFEALERFVGEMERFDYVKSPLPPKDLLQERMFFAMRVRYLRIISDEIEKRRIGKDDDQINACQ